MKKIISILICCVFLLMFTGCDSGSSNKTTLHSGQSLTLSNDTPVCSSKENLDKMISFISQKNDDGENQMIASGKAKILSKGTKVNIISTGTTIEIETSDNKKWFAPMEVIK